MACLTGGAGQCVRLESDTRTFPFIIWIIIGQIKLSNQRRILSENNYLTEATRRRRFVTYMIANIQVILQKTPLLNTSHPIITQRTTAASQIEALEYLNIIIIMFMLVLSLYFLLKASSEQSPYLRKTTISNKYMNTLSLCYFYDVNGNYYSSWNATIYTYFSDRFKYNLTFYYTASINTMTSGENTYGFQIPLRLTSVTDTFVTLQIVTKSTNFVNGPVWYSVRIYLFLLPNDVPFSLYFFQKKNYSQIGSNLYTPTLKTFPLSFPIKPSFRDYCYYDSAQTIKDKIYVLPFIVQIQITNPEYINLTSSSNWVYDFDVTTQNYQQLPFNVNIIAYNSQMTYFILQAIAICPNSYKYAQNGLSMAISTNNWFVFEPTNSLFNQYRTVFLQYPFSNDPRVMLGMQITGLSIHYSNFNTLTATAGTSLMFASFNITQGYDANGGYTGYLGNLSYNIVNPWNCFGFYFMFGSLGSCPNNLVQFNATHCVCPPQNIFSYKSGKCLSCRAQFGSSCNTCDETKCLSCDNKLYLYQTGNKTQCLDCGQLYGNQCSKCSDINCLKCQNNYTIDNNKQCSCQFFYNFIDIVSGMCTQCPFKFQFCINCTYNGCFDCLGRFSPTNGSCICIFPNILALGNCFSCPDLFGIACILCTNGSCLQCDTNFQLFNNSCHCVATGVTLIQQKCIKCSYIYGQGCLSCNQSACLKCDFNFQNNVTNCICPAIEYTISNSECYQCRQLYPYCVVCNNLACIKCLANFQLTNHNCTCSQDRYLTLGGGCQLCSNVHQNCLSCNRSSCWFCKQNFTLFQGVCLCQYPRFLSKNLPNSCLRCQDIKGSLQACYFSVRGQFYQSGKKLYFWLRYSRIQNQINFTLPIQFNTKVAIDGIAKQFGYDVQTGIFNVDLSSLNGTSTAEVKILSNKDVVSNGVQLSDTILRFSVSQVQSPQIFDRIVNNLMFAKNYAILAMVMLSLGAYSNLFKTMTIINIICLSQQNLPNSIGLINDAFNINSQYFPIKINLGLPKKRIPSQQLPIVAYALNQPIIIISLQLYIAGIFSIFLVAYIRGYLKTKRNATKHSAFRSILQHSKQYLLQSLLSLHTILSFPALLQIKLIYSQGLNSIMNNLTNFLVAGFLLVVQCLIIFLYMIVYRIDKYSYTVLYNQMRPKKLTAAYWLLSTIQPSVISAFTLFAPQQLKLYLIIGVNSLSFLFLISCFLSCLSKAADIIDLLKSGCLLYVSVALIFNNSDSLILKIAAYSIIVVCFLDFLQILFKTVRLVLRNKGLLSASSKVASEVAEQQNKTKSGKVNYFLNQVKNDLYSRIKRRKKCQ